MASYLHAWETSDGLDLLIGRWNADYDDPDNVTHTLFHSRTGLLRSYFSSPEADRLLEEARSETRLSAREALYRRFEALLAQAGALLPLFHDIDYRLASDRVHGLRLRGIAPYVNYVGIGTREAAEPEPEARPATGGSLHVPMAGVVTNLDPAATETLDQSDLIPLVFETLTRDAGGAAVVPWLAAEFLPEEGGRRYRFRLRDGVRFSDGRRLTARDVRYSFERLLRSGGESRFLFAPIRGARALLAGETADLAGIPDPLRERAHDRARGAGRLLPRAHELPLGRDRARGRRPVRARDVGGHGPVPRGLLRAGPAPGARAQPQLLAQGLPAQRGADLQLRRIPRGHAHRLPGRSLRPRLGPLPGRRRGASARAAVHGRLSREPPPPHVLRRLQLPAGNPGGPRAAAAAHGRRGRAPGGAPAPGPPGHTRGRSHPAGAPRLRVGPPARGLSRGRRTSA